MAISDGTLSAADIAAVTGANNGLGFGGDGGAFWLLILFLFAFNNNGWGGWGNGGGNNGTPYIVSDVQRGFDQSALMNSLTGVQTSLSNGFANAEVSRCNTLANLTGQISALAMAQQNCCCENRAATADLKYTVATEACADRQAVTDALQVVTNAINTGVQSIKDQMCQDKIDSKNEEIANLRTQINLANLAASQNAQTAAIIANNEAQTNALERYLSPTPIPAYIVSNPNGCNCGGFTYGGYTA